MDNLNPKGCINLCSELLKKELALGLRLSSFYAVKNNLLYYFECSDCFKLQGV